MDDSHENNTDVTNMQGIDFDLASIHEDCSMAHASLE